MEEEEEELELKAKVLEAVVVQGDLELACLEAADRALVALELEDKVQVVLAVLVLPEMAPPVFLELALMGNKLTIMFNPPLHMLRLMFALNVSIFLTEMYGIDANSCHDFPSTFRLQLSWRHLLSGQSVLETAGVCWVHNAFCYRQDTVYTSVLRPLKLRKRSFCLHSPLISSALMAKQG